ncbi:SPFH domain-containing protein [Salisaeta longa]|uniref:SPFH domain-containing protein n=1 Tax=Salisaeta longa TaxID=503170 RepID=UPI0003B79D7A|nr:stomatin-like protein [Salisaeta longa]
MLQTLNDASLAILGLLALYILYKFLRAIRLVPQQSAYVVERLGNYSKTLDAGFHALVPFFDRVAYVHDLREQAIPVEPQDCFTSDNVRVRVDGVIYISVSDPVNASYGVTDYRRAAIQLAQTTTRSVIGRMELDTTFQERALISQSVVDVLDEVDEAWGIRVHRYEIKNIDTPRTVQKAMERQMTAERDRRAVVARSEGEQQSTVNDAEGQKQELINQSEGEMQRRINEAEGRAQEIEEIANATAEAIESIADAVSKPGGEEAVKLRLAEQYLDTVARLGRQENKVLLPADLTRYDAVLSGLALDDFALQPSGAPTAQGDGAAPDAEDSTA